jgi:hypothetical protein
MRRAVELLLSLPLLSLLGCGGSQHAVEEKYFFITTNIKLP